MSSTATTMKFSVTLICAIFSLSVFSQTNVAVYFGSNSYDLSDVEKKKLDTIDRKLPVLSITGFADSQGEAVANQLLSDNRVTIVSDYLRQSGFAFSKAVVSKGVGEKQSASEVVAQDRKVTVSFGPLPATIPQQQTNVKDITSAKVGQKVMLENVNFQPGSPKMLQKSGVVVRKLVDQLKANEKIKIDIQGHICCIDPDGKYKSLYTDLSTERAKTVYDFLGSCQNDCIILFPKWIT
ncbi:MAG: hypothetical protein EOO01_12305, partial [Chitinophagaceae bacterium]